MIDRRILDDILTRALEEDVGTGDITTLCTVPEDRVTSGRYIAKSVGIVCGLQVVERTFELLDPHISFIPHVTEGQAVATGTVIAEVVGNARNILTGERVGLNLLQRLSGIATSTAKAVAAVEGTKARITDTRKTIPGLRVLEKYAVRVGGGSNHRFNLTDGILIKDNHIEAAGGITAAVQAARRNAPHTLKIEVEVENLDQVEEALACGADIIMLDNMNLETMTEAVRRIAGRAMTEASGNMGDRDLRAVAATGVDLISVGALTHTVRVLDISLKLG